MAPKSNNLKSFKGFMEYIVKNTLTQIPELEDHYDIKKFNDLTLTLAINNAAISASNLATEYVTSKADNNYCQNTHQLAQFEFIRHLIEQGVLDTSKHKNIISFENGSLSSYQRTENNDALYRISYDKTSTSIKKQLTTNKDQIKLHDLPPLVQNLNQAFPDTNDVTLGLVDFEHNVTTTIKGDLNCGTLITQNRETFITGNLKAKTLASATGTVVVEGNTNINDLVEYQGFNGMQQNIKLHSEGIINIKNINAQSLSVSSPEAARVTLNIELSNLKVDSPTAFISLHGFDNKTTISSSCQTLHVSGETNGTDSRKIITDSTSTNITRHATHEACQSAFEKYLEVKNQQKPAKAVSATATCNPCYLDIINNYAKTTGR